MVPLVVKNPPTNAGDARDMGSIPGLGRFLGGEHGNPLQFLPGESHGQRSLAGYSPWGHKESDMTEWLTLLLYLFYPIYIICLTICLHDYWLVFSYFILWVIIQNYTIYFLALSVPPLAPGSSFSRLFPTSLGHNPTFFYCLRLQLNWTSVNLS